MFKFQDNAFGNAFEVVAQVETWKGWNMSYSQHLSSVTYVKNPQHVTCLLQQNVFNTMILERFFFWIGDNRTKWPNAWQLVVGHPSTLITFTNATGTPLKTPKTSDLTFAEITIGPANHWSVKFMPDESVPHPVVDESNVIIRVFCIGSATGTTQLSWTMKFYAHTVRVSGSITVTEYEPRTGNCINSIPIHRLFRLQQG